MICTIIGASAAMAQAQLTGVDGSKVELEKGWKYIKAYTDKEKRVRALYTYQIGSVTKPTGSIHRFVVKTKDFGEEDEDFTLTTYEAKCMAEEMRSIKFVTRLKNGKSETVDDPNAKFEVVEQDSLRQMIFIAFCKDNL